MKLSLVLGFWVGLYFIYVLHSIFCATVVTDFFGISPAQIYKYTLLLILYFYAARLYIKMSRRMHYRTRPWRTGLIWMSLFLLCDFFLLSAFFSFRMDQFISLFFIWKGRLYGVQLLTLLTSPSIMRWYRKRYRRDPIMNFLKYCNDGLSEYLLRKFYGFK